MGMIIMVPKEESNARTIALRRRESLPTELIRSGIPTGSGLTALKMNLVFRKM